MSDVQLESSWNKALHSEFSKPYFEELTKIVREQYLTKKVYPPP